MVKTRLRENGGLAVALLTAAAIRLVGLGHGLPYLYTDEPTFVVPVTQMLATGDPNPHWFGHPGSFLMYALAALFLLVSAMLAVFWTVTGRAHGLAELKAQFDPDLYRDVWRPVYYVSGRLFVVAMALVSIYLVYRLGKRLFGRNAGILAAFMIALSPMHIVFSRVIRTDMPGMMLITASSLFLVTYLDGNKKKWFYAAALTAGLAVACKYTNGLAVLPVMAAACCAPKDRVKLLIAAAAWAFLGFFLAAPFVILDFKKALIDILVETEPSHLGADRLPGLATHLWYLKHGLRQGIGGIFFEVLAAAGVILSFRERRSRALIFLLFPAVYFIVMGFGNLRIDRWMLPVLPFEAVFAAAALTDPKLKRRFPKLVVAVLALTAFFFARNAGLEWQAARKLTRIDTRTMAKAWAEANLPEGASIAYEDYAPRFDTRNTKRFRLMDRGWDQIVSQPLAYYKEAGVGYIVITDSIKSRYYAERDRYPVQVARYEELKEKATLVHVVREPEHPGPVIEIYALGR